jgi:hypothetical protein
MFTNSDLQVFKKDLHSIIIQLIRCIKTILLSLSLDRTHFLQFLTKNSHEIDPHISMKTNKFLKSILPNFYDKW